MIHRQLASLCQADLFFGVQDETPCSNLAKLIIQLVAQENSKLVNPYQKPWNQTRNLPAWSLLPRFIGRNKFKLVELDLAQHLMVQNHLDVLVNWRGKLHFQARKSRSWFGSWTVGAWFDWTPSMIFNEINVYPSDIYGLHKISCIYHVYIMY